MKNYGIAILASILLANAILLASCEGSRGAAGPTASVPATETASPSPIVPTATRASTRTPTPVPPPFEAFYELPAWMSDPDTRLLAALVADLKADWGKITFVDASSGALFDIPIPRSVYGLFWQDPYTFGFLMEDLQSTYLLDLRDGSVSIQTVSPTSVRLLSRRDEIPDDSYRRVWTSIMALRVEPDQDPDTTFFRSADTIRDAYHYPYSLKGSFRVEVTGEDGNAFVVKDVVTGETIWQSHPLYGRWDAGFAWSPADDSILAVVSGRPEPLNGFITEDMLLSIVDVQAKKLLASYTGDFGLIQWSPDGNRILYVNAYQIIMNGETYDGPWIIDVRTGVKKHLRNISTGIPGAPSPMITSDYRWAPDGISIFFTDRWTPTTSDEILGDVCAYDLLTGQIGCPTESLHVHEGLRIIYYTISPDESFIYVCYSANNTQIMLNSNLSDGIVSLDGDDSTSWVGLIQPNGDQTCSNQTLWRPLP